MNFSSLVFPAPKPSYCQQSLLGDLIYVPRKLHVTKLLSSQEIRKKVSSQNDALSAIPCLYLPYPNGSSKLLIYFHGNAEDIGLSYELLDHMRSSFKINIMAVEYPGYGIYTDVEGPDEDKIKTDAEDVLDFVL